MCCTPGDLFKAVDDSISNDDFLAGVYVPWHSMSQFSGEGRIALAKMNVSSRAHSLLQPTLLSQMHRVDRLNRQYEKLRDAVEEPENMGPLEASIKNLQKEVASVGSLSGKERSPDRKLGKHLTFPSTDSIEDEALKHNEFSASQHSQHRACLPSNTHREPTVQRVAPTILSCMFSLVK